MNKHQVDDLISQLEVRGDFELIEIVRNMWERMIKLKASNSAYMLALSNGPVIHVHNQPMPIVNDRIDQLQVIEPVTYRPAADTNAARVWTRVELKDWATAKLVGMEGYVPLDEHKGYARAMQHLLMHLNSQETEL